MTHTMQEDFEFFLSASGLRNQPQDVVEKMRLAFEFAWEPTPCPKCGQISNGQGGEYPCPECGLPTLHDA